MKRIGMFAMAIISLFSVTVLAITEIEHTEEIVPLMTLFEEPSLYDGKKVSVTGEVIGDIMGNGEHFWVNIKDKDCFMGIVIDASQKEKIRYAGRYRMKGDIIKVAGIYHLHCPVHFGERDIHSEQIDIIESGYEIPEDIHSNKIMVSILLGVITVFILLYSQRKNVRKDIDGQLK